jgi:hypothetical protein
VAARVDPKDPRFLRYRGAMYGLFIVVCAFVSIVICVSVVRSVWAMSPSALPASDRPLTFRECLDAADRLWHDLDERRQQLPRQSPVRSADAAWYAFRLEWLQRYRLAEAQCALDSHERTELKALYARLEYLMDLYTTSAVQYDGQVGPAVDAFRAALSEAKKSPSAGRF